MMHPLAFFETGYDALTSAVERVKAASGRGHIHTTPPGCALTGRADRGILFEATDEGRAFAFFDSRSIEARAKPLAILLHGAESVPEDDDVLAPACEAVNRMAERMRLGQGHFHILTPPCLANPHPGRWTIVFEDAELGLLQSVSDERPLADIRLIERLIYAAPSADACSGHPGTTPGIDG
jgi:hypothetical protein